MKKNIAIGLLSLVWGILPAQTFTVDKNLPAPEKHLFTKAGTEWVGAIKSMNQNTKTDIQVMAYSYGQDTLGLVCKDPFFRSFVTAYAEHRPLVLSPDMVWLSICQGFSHYVNKHAEKMRDKLVSHQGKVTLSVEVSPQMDMLQPDADWSSALKIFEDSIAGRCKGEIAQILVADFSTTEMTERVASQITLMGTMKQYFNYQLIRIACGIPSVTLEGTTADWEHLLVKINKLAPYVDDDWVKELRPVLKEFVRSSKGKVNLSFWQSMICKNTPDKLESGGGCGPGKTTLFDGWFLKFFPYNQDGRTPKKVAHNTNRMLAEVQKTPFIYVDQVRGLTMNMEMWAGFIGAEEDPATFALRPKMGWMVVTAETTDSLILQLSQASIPKLKVKEFPEVARKVGKLEWLQIEFEGAIQVPDWIDEVQVEQLDLYGKFDDALLARLRELLPGREIDTIGDKCIIVNSHKKEVVPVVPITN